MRALRQMFAFKGVQSLIFDEFPYKKYMVKVAQPPQLKYIPFDHLEFRIYKGEGSVQLVAYYPYALGVVSPHLDNTTGGIINNNGDMSANLEIIYSISNSNFNGCTLNLKDINENIIGALTLGNFNTADSYILINNYTHLIEGLDTNKEKSGKLYNEYIIDGDFFSPPTGRSILQSNIQFVSASYTPRFY